MDMILAMIQQLMASHPQIVSVLVIIGGLRVVFKPLMGAVQAWVDYTVDTKDNEMLAKFIDSPIYKALSYFFDLVGSIKLPQSK